MKKLLLSLFAIICTFFIIQNVNAVSIVPYDFLIFGVHDLPTQNWIRTNNTQKISQTIFTLNTTNITTSLPSDVQLFTELYACVVHDGAGDLGDSTYITNVDQKGGFKNGKVNSVNLNVPCKVPDGYPGTMYKFYFQIYSWEVPSGGADFSRVSSYWHFGNFTMKTLNITITNIYITDSDNYLDDATLASQGKGQQVIINQNETIINNTENIKNNQEDIKNNTEDIKGALNDDSIDTSQSDSFFDGFNNEDNLLSSVVLFPIQILNNVDSACTPLTLPFESDKMKANDYSLPCGDKLFWNKPKVAEFKKFWNFIVGAPIIYGCLLWSFKTIQKLKNPFDNEVEMIEL